MRACAHLTTAASTLRQARGYLPSRRVSPPIGRYLLRIPMEIWPGLVDLGIARLLHTEMDYRLSALKMVTHTDSK